MASYKEISPTEEVLPLSPGEFPVTYAGPAGKKTGGYREISTDEEILALQPPSLLQRGISAVKAIPSLLPSPPPSTPITTPPATMAGTPLATPPTPMGGGIDIRAAAPVVDKIATSVATQTGKPPAAPLPPPRPRPAFQVDPLINERAEAQRGYYRGFFAPGQVRAQEAERQFNKPLEEYDPLTDTWSLPPAPAPTGPLITPTETAGMAARARLEDVASSVLNRVLPFPGLRKITTAPTTVTEAEKQQGPGFLLNPIPPVISQACQGLTQAVRTKASPEAAKLLEDMMANYPALRGTAGFLTNLRRNLPLYDLEGRQFRRGPFDTERFARATDVTPTPPIGIAPPTPPGFEPGAGFTMRPGPPAPRPPVAPLPVLPPPRAAPPPVPPIQPTPVAPTPAGSQIERIVEAARKQPLKVVESAEWLATNGKWYKPQGVPWGVQLTDEKRVVGYAYQTPEGTTVGTRYPTREAAEEAQRKRLDATDAEFRQALQEMTPEEIQRQADYWLKEKPERKAIAEQVVKPPQAREPSPEQARLKQLESTRFKTAAQEKEIEIIKARLAADPSKWNIGEGVGRRIGIGKGSQINRGFRIIAIDPDAKTATIRQVADTGITVTCGADPLPDENVKLADMVRE